MSCRSARVLLGAIVLLGVFVSSSRGEARKTMSLDGVWNFATDPDNRGEAEKWYRPGTKLPAMPLPGYAPTANGTIRVPGIWDNQGYGTETERLRHSFIGKGWYKRQVEIPPGWSGRRVFLVITGVCRYAKVWINDQFLGEHIGVLSAQEYDVTKYVAPGRSATITIQVDSKQRWEVDAMYGCSFLADYLDAAWGGIWGHVALEAAIRRLAERSVRAARRTQCQLLGQRHAQRQRRAWPTVRSSMCSTGAANAWRKRR